MKKQVDLYKPAKQPSRANAPFFFPIRKLKVLLYLSWQTGLCDNQGTIIITICQGKKNEAWTQTHCMAGLQGRIFCFILNFFLFFFPFFFLTLCIFSLTRVSPSFVLCSIFVDFLHFHPPVLKPDFHLSLG